MAENDKLKDKIKDLEAELQHKTAENLKLRVAVKDANVRLEKMIVEIGHELKLAARIQKLLAPTQMPTIQGFEFSSKFLPGESSGGDYFDIFEHEDRLRFGIVLASSSGYTISALFLSVLIKMASKMEARKGLPPEKVLKQMSEEIVPQMAEKDLANVFYGFIDRRSFELNYSLAGNIVGFYQAHGESTLTRLNASCAPFSKQFKSDIAAHRLSLGPRDKLILCTDGLIQAKNKQGESFGIERLTQAILKVSTSQVHDVRNEILYRVEKYTGQIIPDRDQTVIICEVKDRVIKLAKS